ncbi:MAG: hypothetical protein HOF70_19145 [Rhodospirillaceae bacterium]|nr:hypothetical protein [Rhodospirillaceae bacterium]MBT5181339.1 hypothetical protein [Rhodospirillaceae bacterium]MBT6857962.1 hypothetical protein [Rhodospirillaceae bacterium]MBT7569183.1 hypothetical protein [Rhodospirillaceae bacterium]
MNSTYNQLPIIMMIPSQPSQKSVEIYNRLIKTPYDATEVIGQIEWQLQHQLRNSRSDGNSAVALLQALNMQGKAEEAQNLALDIWGIKHLLSEDAKPTFIYLLTGLGMFEKALQLGPEELSAWNGNMLGPTLQAIGIGLGDLNILNAASNLVALNPKGSEQLSGFISSWSDIGLDKHFHQQQATVHKVMEGKFTEYSAIFQDAEADDIELCVYYHVQGDRRKRRMLEEAIDDAIASFYDGIGGVDDPFYFTARLNYIVADITSKWPIKLDATKPS